MDSKHLHKVDSTDDATLEMIRLMALNQVLIKGQLDLV